MEFLKIILLSVAAAIGYGIVHDQITARICIEYFTVGHPPVFHTTSPTLLGLGWGIIATWWVGLLLGIPLAVCAGAGTAPPLTARDLVRPILALLITMAVLAAVMGVAGYMMVQVSGFRLESMLRRLRDDRHQPFIACWFAHMTSYAVGFVGGIVLCVQTVLRRRKMAPK